MCERTLRRYIESGRISYHRLPGGHYRIAEQAIAAFWAEHDRRRSARHPARAAARHAPLAPPRTAARRAPLGAQTEDGEYDLSDEHLAELRARVAASRTGRQ